MPQRGEHVTVKVNGACANMCLQAATDIIKTLASDKRITEKGDSGFRCRSRGDFSTNEKFGVQIPLRHGHGR